MCARGAACWERAIGASSLEGFGEGGVTAEGGGFQPGRVEPAVVRWGLVARCACEPGRACGLVVRLGSRMLDTSLRTQLHNLKLAMKGVG